MSGFPVPVGPGDGPGAGRVRGVHFCSKRVGSTCFVSASSVSGMRGVSNGGWWVWVRAERPGKEV